MGNPARGRPATAGIVSVAVGIAALAAQPISVAIEGDAIRIRAPEFRFVKGAALERLQDGRSVRFDFQLAALTNPAMRPVASTRQTFVVSYDLWEERFAVMHVTAVDGTAPAATPPRAISHVTVREAEAWCLERLTIKAYALRAVVHQPLWVRLEYEAQDGGSREDGPASFSLRGLIDRLSQRRTADPVRDSVVAGPFHLQNVPRRP